MTLKNKKICYNLFYAFGKFHAILSQVTAIFKLPFLFFYGYFVRLRSQNLWILPFVIRTLPSHNYRALYIYLLFSFFISGILKAIFKFIFSV